MTTEMTNEGELKNTVPEAEQEQQAQKKAMSPGKQFWHFIAGKDGRSGQVYGKNGSQSGMSHRQMESYLQRRARKSTRPGEESILASVLSIVFSNTKIEENKKQKGQWVKEVVKPGKVSSGLR